MKVGSCITEIRSCSPSVGSCNVKIKPCLPCLVLQAGQSEAARTRKRKGLIPKRKGWHGPEGSAGKMKDGLARGVQRDQLQSDGREPSPNYEKKLRTNSVLFKKKSNFQKRSTKKMYLKISTYVHEKKRMDGARKRLQ